MTWFHVFAAVWTVVALAALVWLAAAIRQVWPRREPTRRDRDDEPPTVG